MAEKPTKAQAAMLSALAEGRGAKAFSVWGNTPMTNLPGNVSMRTYTACLERGWVVSARKMGRSEIVVRLTDLGRAALTADKGGE